jgi:hypothetical protein
MARTEDWIAVTIKNKKTGEAVTLYHPPESPSAGQTVDQRLRRVLGMPSPARSKPSEPDNRVTIEALPSKADWLTSKVPALP